MTTRMSLLRALSLAAAIAALARCGGGAPAPAKGQLDVETGETSGEAAPKARKRQPPAPLALGSVAPLSLEGIPLPEPPAEPSREGKENTSAGKADKPQPPPPEVNAPPPRNLFAFEEDPAVVMERRKQAEEAARAQQEASKKADEARRRWQGPPLPPPPPQPPGIPFQFIGYMGPPEARIGVFSGQGLILARKGDVIQSQFKIVSIGYESAEIGFQGFTQTQRIPLTPGGK